MLPVLTPTDFVALTNQTLEFAYPSVQVEGEVLNFKVSRGRWVYFDVADEMSKLRCFGTVYMLPAPIEDGMMIRLSASPRLHPQFGFSLNIQSLELSGEGSIKKASDLLQAKLEKEGLFASDRKRILPYPPKTIGLITSEESAAYKDFIKVLSGRLGGMDIQLANVQVQGEAAVGQVVRAIEWFNSQASTPDVIVIVRGGGSADDLQAFSSEQVTRAVSASRVPTLVAIGHEIDVSLAELAADVRASTPSNAAEILVPDRNDLLKSLARNQAQLESTAEEFLVRLSSNLASASEELADGASGMINRAELDLNSQKRTVEALSPVAVLRRGYTIVRSGGKVVKDLNNLPSGKAIDIQHINGQRKAVLD